MILQHPLLTGLARKGVQCRAGAGQQARFEILVADLFKRQLAAQCFLLHFREQEVGLAPLTHLLLPSRMLFMDDGFQVFRRARQTTDLADVLEAFGKLAQYPRDGRLFFEAVQEVLP